MKRIIKLRQQIDKIDNGIIKLIAQRLAVVKEIGILKKQLGLSIQDAERENKLFMAYERLSEGYGLDKKVINKIFVRIISQGKKIMRIK